MGIRIQEPVGNSEVEAIDCSSRELSCPAGISRRLRFRGRFALLTIAMSSLILTSESCGRRDEKKVATPSGPPSAPASGETPAASPPPLKTESPVPSPVTLSFKRQALPKQNTWRWFLQEYTEPQRGILQKLNRKDLLKIRPGEELIVPIDWNYSPLAYSPFPMRSESIGQFQKAIVVSLRTQAFGAYETGQLVQWGPVNSGRRDTPTPTGLLHLTWKAKERVSTDNPEWLLRWYFNLVNGTGVSFHLYELPGYPVSHACLRLLERDAQWLYSWGDQWKLDSKTGRVVEQGTPVLVFDSYAFGQKPPWRRLPEDPSADHVTAEHIAEASAKLSTPERTGTESSK